jgi:folate-binding protein YgfZ
MLQLPLATVHRTATSSFLERWSYELPAHYGDPVTEQRLMAQVAGVLDQSCRGVLDLVGEGVIEAVDHLFSSTVTETTAHAVQPSCLLSPKGRLVAGFHVLRLEENRLRLFLREPATEGVVKSLERYLLLSDVTVASLDGELGMLSVLGPAAGAIVGPLLDAPVPQHGLACAGGTYRGLAFHVVRTGDTPEGGLELWAPLAVLESLWLELDERARALGGGVVGQTAFDALRIEAGVPLQSQDYTEDSFPNEVGWESALTYDKCYVGQEVVARMRTYGQVHRRLKGLRFSGAVAPTPGAAVTSGDEPVGVVTSAAFSERLGCPIALALIKRKHWKLGTARVEAGSAAVDCEVVELPFVTVAESHTPHDPV